jgi:hypothetical protein
MGVGVGILSCCPRAFQNSRKDYLNLGHPLGLDFSANGTHCPEFDLSSPGTLVGARRRNCGRWSNSLFSLALGRRSESRRPRYHELKPMRPYCAPCQPRRLRLLNPEFLCNTFPRHAVLLSSAIIYQLWRLTWTTLNNWRLRVHSVARRSRVKRPGGMNTGLGTSRFVKHAGRSFLG